MQIEDKKILEKYNFLVGLHGVQDVIDYFLRLSDKYCLYLAFSGSILSLEYKSGSDIDIILIIPDDLILDIKNVFPDFIEKKFLIQVSNETILNRIDVIGSNYISNPAIRLEIYKESTALKIINQTIFTISRVKDVPKKNKIELFINYEGQTINKPLYKQDFISQTFSFIEKEDLIHWGMHYERLLISDKLIDSLNFDCKIINARIKFMEKYNPRYNLEQLFYVSRNEFKIDICKYLKI